MVFTKHQLEKMLELGWQEKLPPICLDCGYNLTGLTGNRCPECGCVFIRSEVVRQAREIKAELWRLSSCNELLKTGACIGVIGVVLMLGFGAAGQVHAGFLPFAGLAGLIGGVPTASMGMQMFRVKRLPKWAQPLLEPPPSFLKAWGLTLLGVGMVMTGLAIFGMT